MTVPYYVHLFSKRQYEGLQQYIQEQFDDEIPQAILDYADYLKDRFEEHPVPLFELSDADLRDPEDCRYPSEQFLISLTETWLDINPESFKKLMDLVNRVWYDMYVEDFAKCKNGEYQLYTMGWSGNEDIIAAMKNNQSIMLLTELDDSRPTVRIRYRFADWEDDAE